MHEAFENMEEIAFLSTSKDGIKIRKGAFAGISPEAKFYSKASAEPRKKTLKRIKKSGYKTITEVTKI